MNMPSGAEEGPPDLGLDDERRTKGRRDIMALDIETVPKRSFWPVTSPGGLDGEPVKRYVHYDIDPYWLERHEKSEAKEAWGSLSAPFKDTGQIPSCHPTTAHIVSVSCGLVGERGTVTVETAQFDDFIPDVLEMVAQQESSRPRRLDEYTDVQLFEAERGVLRRTWQLIDWAFDRGLTIVTFNGKQFDFPMLRWRSKILEVKMPKVNWYEMLYRFRHKEHIDIRLVISDGDTRAKGTMSLWCEVFGVDVDDCGELVFPWAERGQWDKIRSYGEKEMHSLVGLFHRIEGAL